MAPHSRRYRANTLKSIGAFLFAHVRTYRAVSPLVCLTAVGLSQFTLLDNPHGDSMRARMNDDPSPPVYPPTPPANERAWAMWCHMSALAAIPFPAFGAVVAPLIIWQLKRNESPLIDEHGKEALNFQLSVFIYLMVGAVAAVGGMFFCIGWVLVPFLIAIHYAAIVFGVVAGIKANEGLLYRYPLNLRLVK